MYKPVLQIDGVKTAQVMLLVGTDDAGASFPDWGEHLALAMQIQQQMNSLWPGLARPITLRTARFNQQLTKGSLLVEVGGHGNSLEEALAGAGCLPGRRRRSCWSGWRNRHRKRPPGGKPSPFYRWETGDRAEPVWFGPVSDYGDGEGEAWPAAPPPASSSSGGAAGSSVELSGSSGWEGSAGTLGSTGSVGCSGSPGKRGLFRRGNLLLRRLCADGGVVLAGEVEQGVDGIVLVPHLKVAVGPSGPPGRAHRSDG